jgi:hypothetical protein
VFTLCVVAWLALWGPREGEIAPSVRPGMAASGERLEVPTLVDARTRVAPAARAPAESLEASEAPAAARKTLLETLGESCSLVVEVVDGQGHARPDVPVLLAYRADRDCVVQRTNADGRARFEGLPFARVSVALVGRELTAVELSIEEETRLELVDLEPESIRVRIVDPAGSGVGEAWVEVSPYEGNPMFARVAQADAFGFAELPLLPAEFFLRAARTGWASGWGLPIGVLRHAAEPPYELLLCDRVCRIQVEALDAGTGVPLAASYRVRSEVQGWAQSCSFSERGPQGFRTLPADRFGGTDALGRAELELPAEFGRIAVSVYRPGYYTEVLSLSHLDPLPETLRFELEPARLLSGTLRTTDGSVPVEPLVRLLAGGQSLGMVASVFRDGRFEFAQQSREADTIEAISSEGLQTKVALSSELVFPIELVLAPPEPSLELFGVGGAPLVGWRVARWVAREGSGDYYGAELGVTDELGAVRARFPLTPGESLALIAPDDAGGPLPAFPDEIIAFDPRGGGAVPRFVVEDEIPRWVDFDLAGLEAVGSLERGASLWVRSERLQVEVRSNADLDGSRMLRLPLGRYAVRSAGGSTVLAEFELGP